MRNSLLSLRPCKRRGRRWRRSGGRRRRGRRRRHFRRHVVESSLKIWRTWKTPHEVRQVPMWRIEPAIVALVKHRGVLCHCVPPIRITLVQSLDLEVHLAVTAKLEPLHGHVYSHNCWPAITSQEVRLYFKPWVGVPLRATGPGPVRVLPQVHHLV